MATPPRADWPFTRSELEAAHRMRNAWGWCRHDPKCNTADECTKNIIRHMRGEAEAS